MKYGNIDIKGSLSLANGGFEKIYDDVLSSSSSSVTITGLDGNTDVIYILRVAAKLTAASNIYVKIGTSSGIDTGTNYGYQRLQAQDSTISAGRGSTASGLFLGGGNTNYVSLGELILYAKSGKERASIHIQDYYGYSTTVERHYIYASSWNNTSDNITQLRIDGSMDSGTHIELWRKI